MNFQNYAGQVTGGQKLIIQLCHHLCSAVASLNIYSVGLHLWFDVPQCLFLWKYICRQRPTTDTCNTFRTFPMETDTQNGQSRAFIWKAELELGGVEKRQDIKNVRPRFCCLLAMGLRASCIISVWLNFLTCKVGALIELLFWDGSSEINT